MGLDQVIEQVRAEGEKEAQALIEEAEEEAQAILDEAKTKAEETKESRLEEARQQAKAEKRRILAGAELDAKKKRLEAESDILSSIRSRVATRLKNLPDEERAALLRSLVEDSSAKEWDDAKAWARRDDQDVVEDLGFTFEGEIDCLGGALIESPDGSIREDLRFDTVLDEVWREQMHEVSMDVLER